MSNKSVYVAEVWLNGERIEQIVHVNEEDAYDEIEDYKPELVEAERKVHERSLYLGQSNRFEATREPYEGGIDTKTRQELHNR